MIVLLYGDRWWLATVILFSPRWLLLLPLPVLAIAALISDRRALLVILATALVVAFPVMGFQFGFGRETCPPSSAMRVITCNLNSGGFDCAALSRLISDYNPDVIAFQEAPKDLCFSLPDEWWMEREGELVLLSRYPLLKKKVVRAIHPPHEWPRVSLLLCDVKVEGRSVSIATVHLPSPRYGLMNILDRTTIINLSRLTMLELETENRWRVAANVRASLKESQLPIMVTGDFNMPIDSAIYRTMWGEYKNAFSVAGLGYGWTERASVRWLPVRVRIDHVLTDPVWRVATAGIGPDIGSDHLPLIVDLCL